MNNETYKHRAGQAKDCPMGPMFKINQAIKRSSLGLIQRHGMHEICAYAKTRHNNGQTRGEGEGTNDTVERKGGIENIQIQKESEPSAHDTSTPNAKRVGNALDEDKKDDADNRCNQNNPLRSGYRKRKSENTEEAEGDLYRFDSPPPY